MKKFSWDKMRTIVLIIVGIMGIISGINTINELKHKILCRQAKNDVKIQYLEKKIDELYKKFA